MNKILFFTFLICIYLAAGYYVFNHIWELINNQSYIVRSIFWIFSAVLTFSVILFYFTYKNLPVNIASILYKIGTGWLILLIYPFLLFVVLDGLAFINSYLHFLSENLLHYWGTMAVVLITVVLSLYGYVNYHNKRRISFSLTTQKELKKPLKILAISDMHLGYVINSKELQQWVTRINEEKPDIVLIAGDIVDNSTLPLNYYKLYDFFNKIKAPLGIYSCLGNHEYLSGINNSIEFIQKSGIRLLRDSSVLVDEWFYIIGRDDKTNLQRKELSELMKGLDKNKLVILLDHQPYHLEEAEQNNIDFQLSGHTHRGQVWPFSLITDYIYEKSHGYIKKGNTHIYVSSGIGIWGGRLRIGTQSEYAVIELHS